MATTNFLIGRGELLTDYIAGPRRGGEKAAVYSYAEAAKRLAPRFTQTAQVLDALPADACPGDYAVAKLTLNPAYIAKSYFPSSLLRTASLVSVGNRNRRIKPEKWSKKKTEPQECVTTEIFVAGHRSAFRLLPALAQQLDADGEDAKQLARVETFEAFAPAEKIRQSDAAQTEFFEAALHLIPDGDFEFIRAAFVRYVEAAQGELYQDLSFRAGTLWFVPLKLTAAQVERVAQFSFIRLIRPMPKLRGLRPVQRSVSVALTCQLPTERAVSAEPSVAILDGGLPELHLIAPWLDRYVAMDDDAANIPEGEEHGLGTSSAFLFGPITPGGLAERPYANVTHYRVLDSKTHEEDPLELYRTLGFIEEVLLSRQHQFINLSLGPSLPIEDNDVHAWTSVIDSLLEDGDTLMAVAVGNNGENDWASGNARIQVPGDCVNALAVGAADSTDTSQWKRASYSAIGPGRIPGAVKPDLMAFGGSGANYFHMLAPGRRLQLAPNLGTSFASPYLLRTAVGTRAVLGNSLRPLAIKALMIHCAEANGHARREVGWGKIPEELAAIITCDDGVARVVYQGELKPGKYLRAKVPIPSQGITGMVTVKATFCYACPTDPQDASSYTRAGLEIVFRPDSGTIKEDKQTADSKGFFDLGTYSGEAERRYDHGKWETALHASKRMQGRTLKAPIFDIHYNARAGGSATNDATNIKYALVITLEAPKHPTLYNDILQAYSKILTPLQPQVTLPIRL
ncbi:MAG: hypothetical protein JWR07_4120 [Nevskia sp.]|nr:hypothetical protein [Nevskia sp.]